MSGLVLASCAARPTIVIGATERQATASEEAQRRFRPGTFKSLIMCPSPMVTVYFQQLPALCGGAVGAGAVGVVAGAPPAGRPITGSSSGLAPRPRPPRPGGVHPSHAGPFCTMRVSALTV